MDSRNWNLSALVSVALIAGLIQAVAGVIMYLAGFYFARGSMLVSALVLLLCLVFGTLWYRSRHTGDFGYAQAFLTGAAISLGTGIVYAVYNLLSINFFYPNFLEEVARAQAASGQGPLDGGRSSLTAASIAIPNLIRLTVLGVILSAIAAPFLRRRHTL